MPNITASGTVTKATDGFVRLTARSVPRTFLFAGSTPGSSCTIEYDDDGSTSRVMESGTITALPKSIVIDANIDLKIVTTGSPNFNLTIA